MRKYCLTTCAKQKLSAAKEKTVEILSIMFAIMLVLAGAAGAIALLGVIIEFLISMGWFPEPENPFKNIFEAGIIGVSVLMVVSLAGWFLLGAYKFIYKIAKSTGTAIAHRFDDNYESCTLFEECKDEENN